MTPCTGYNVLNIHILHKFNSEIQDGALTQSMCNRIYLLIVMFSDSYAQIIHFPLWLFLCETYNISKGSRPVKQPVALLTSSDRTEKTTQILRDPSLSRLSSSIF